MSRKREKAYNPTSRHLLYSYPKRRRPIPPPTTAAGAGETQSQKPSPPPALLIIGLPGDCSVLDLKSRFEIYGPISRIRIDHSGVGFITYRTKSAADDAFAAALDPSFGITIDSKRVQVLWTTDERGREGGGIEAEKMNSSKLVRGEVPLSRHGRGNKLSSVVVNANNNDSDDGSVLDHRAAPFEGRRIVAYDDIL